MSRILIAEDERRIASFLEKGLAANGYTTKVVRTGEDVLNLARRKSFDLLILDIGLPRRTASRCCASCARSASTCGS